MLLAQLRLVDVGPFEDLTFPFAAPPELPRLATVIVGGGGVGKTSLLAAIASTRPGHAMPQSRPWVSAVSAASAVRAVPAAPTAIAEWALDDDDPSRPHPLRVASPNSSSSPALDEREEEAMVRRREQTLFDRRATEGGFVLVALSGARWFSRTPVLLSSPERSILRHDPRATSTFDDATRADAARETKQVLSYAAIAAALAMTAPDPVAARALDEAVRGAVGAVLKLVDFSYVGADAVSLEPTFVTPEGARCSFDDLPNSVRHLVSFVALPLRALAAAYPGRDPRYAQGVALIDDVELHQELSAQRGLVPALREALPRVQWIVTTASTAVALGCEAAEVLALRRMPASRRVELYEGSEAIIH
jgi:hypothetical protein